MRIKRKEDSVVKEEMIRITTLLKGLYPGKYIKVNADCVYFESIGLKFEYGIYVEDVIVHQKFESIAEMSAFISAKQKGNPEDGEYWIDMWNDYYSMAM